MCTTTNKAIYFDIWHRPDALGHLWSSSSSSSSSSSTVHPAVCWCRRSNETMDLYCVHPNGLFTNNIWCYTNYSTEYCSVNQPTYKGILTSSWIELIPTHTLTSNTGHCHPLKSLCKSKAIPLQAQTGLEGSRRLRLPDFKTIGTWR